MEVGAGLFTMQSTAGSPASWPSLYRELLANAALLDELHYDGMWFGEHRLNYDGWCPQPFVAAAAVAARTSTLRVGTAIHALPQHDPHSIAESVGWLHRMSGGRVELGVGLGHNENEYDAVGLSRTQRGARLDHGLDVLQTEWKGSPAPRIWLGGHSQPELRRAATRGYGLILSSSVTLSGVIRIRRELNEHAEAAGRAPGPIGALVNIWVDEDERAAPVFLETAKQHYRERRQGWNWRSNASAPDGGAVGAQVEQHVSSFVAGTPEQVRAALLAYRAAGVELVVALLWRDFSRGAFARMATVFATEVMPALRGADA